MKKLIVPLIVAVAALVLGAVGMRIYGNSASSSAKKPVASASASSTASAAPQPQPSAPASATVPPPTPAPSSQPDAAPPAKVTFECGIWQFEDCSAVPRTQVLEMLSPKDGGDQTKVIDCRKQGQNWQDVFGGDGVLARDKLHDSSVATLDLCACRCPTLDASALNPEERYQP